MIEHFMTINKSGKRDSNPRRPPWEGGILPLNYSRNAMVNVIVHCKVIIKQFYTITSTRAIITKTNMIVIKTVLSKNIVFST